MWRERLDAGEVAVLLQFSSKPLPDLPHVPLAVSLAKTDEARQIITAIEISAAIARTWALPPGVPVDRADVVRTAFAETLRDPEFLSDARRLKMDVDPVMSEELTRLVDNLLKLPPPIVARLKDILK
jgi:tripartite-type tricarboxylate transporter receptor subunit TctC